MKLKLIMGLIGVLSLSSFSTLPSSDDTDKKPQESWVIGPFLRPEGVNPVLVPQPTSFHCPMRKEQVKWEESDVFNPAATVKDGKNFPYRLCRECGWSDYEETGQSGTFSRWR